ncbi:Bug family tripartite tricarboxylate transporter substrate binding protein [Variovorax guangxiensis]|uniref:Tripartite tricarboxylate transporter substrate binding protein n=1 Tax=Variovorax guangxiensis TaxID=1775474 RepID=A0A502E0C1_9BURK|nr:tripartite tricarboxylate transporter substrate-binding protein [Variovorax guangxiensis]TPG27076.1 tripartite tricarboxylate transporter substrate binding protein [Variovorax ginsengisoli]TPG30804.1 tripartite tricarboxylate transporter substrate binding protein [Variovorax guangxiensis]
MKFRLPSRPVFAVAFVAGLVAATTGVVHAQPYPSKPTRLIVGYTAGGASDVIGRLIANELSAMNGQPVIVENRPGVGGMLGLNNVETSPPDGYTLGVAVSGTMVTGPHLQKNTPYDPLTAFEPISMVAKAPMVMLASPAVADPTVRSFIQQAKAKPGELMFASGAQAFELAMQLFNAKAGVKIGSVSYPGGGQASIDVMAGRVPIMVDTIGAQQANIKAGKLKAVAVLDSKRSAVLPDVPTVAEAGVPGYEAVGWVGIVAPKGTPKEVVAKLNGQLRTIMAMPAINEKLTLLGFEPSTGTSQAFDQGIRTEYAKWGDVVKAAGISAQ